MIFKKGTDEYSVQSIRRTGASGDHSLTWESSGLEYFLVIVGDTSENVQISLDQSFPCQIREALWDAERQLLEEDSITFSNINVSVFKVSFSQLKQKGGFSANGRPGIYAVYGFVPDANECIVYVSENNQMRFTVDVSIEDVPLTYSKGMFKKKEVYSGYHKVSIKSGVPGLKGNSLYYTVTKNNYKYPFPDEVVSDGGSFFVKCAENESVRFGTTNNDGIRIK